MYVLSEICAKGIFVSFQWWLKMWKVVTLFSNERHFEIWFPIKKQLHFSEENYLNYTKKTQFCRPVAWGCNAPPDLPKDPLLATKWAKNWVFVGGLRGVRFKKSTVWVQKVHFWGYRTSPKSWLRNCNFACGNYIFPKTRANKNKQWSHGIQRTPE